MKVYRCFAGVLLLANLLFAAGSLNGIVIDGENRLPVDGVTLTLTDHDSVVVATAITDQNGNFTFSDLPSGEYLLSTAHRDYHPLKLYIKIKFWRPKLNLELQPLVPAAPAVVRDEMAEAAYMVDGMALSAKQPLSVKGGSKKMLAGGHFENVIIHNTEEYDYINENKFKSVQADPVSTFSIDVDAASYANLRRYIQNGQLPPADAVRIEEMINYFSYDYPAPEDEHPFSIITEAGECPWNPDHRLIHIGIQGKRPTHSINRATFSSGKTSSGIRQLIRFKLRRTG